MHDNKRETAIWMQPVLQSTAASGVLEKGTDGPMENVPARCDVALEPLNKEDNGPGRGVKQGRIRLIVKSH